MTQGMLQVQFEGWYTLKSKPGKKDKERGEIEVDIQFMRNNMTASMFDLSMKDKSRNPFGKLKDKIKGKNKDSASDTASAIIPSTTPSVDSDEESFSKDKKKKSKIKTLFSKSNLQKTPLSQSMSVLPTSKLDKVLLHPGDLKSRWDDDDNEDESSSASDVMSHKRTPSADHTQLNQTKKEGLSFLGGLRSKNDSLSRSNLCINGNHVYMEQPEAKSEIKDSSPSNSPSPQGFRKKHLFSSTENLAARSPKEPGEGGGVTSDRRLSDSSSKDSVKSMSLPSYRPLTSGDSRESMSPANTEATKETKESKKQENKKSSLLSLVTGKKDVAKGSEGEPLPIVSEKEKERQGTSTEAQLREEDLGRKSERDVVPVASQWGNSLNPFEDVQISNPEASLESKSEPKPPVPAPRAPQTKAVKPRLEVPPKAQPKARLPSSDSAVFPTLPLSSPQAPIFSDMRGDSETQSSESPSASSSFSSPLAAPISTSTPIEHWPPTGKGEADPKEPPLLLKAVSQRESLTPALNTGSSALGSPYKQLPIPVLKGTEESSGSETGAGKEAHSDESGKNPMGKPEELVTVPFPQQHHVPSPEEAQEVPPVLSLSSGRIANHAEKSPTGGNTDSEHQSRSFVENDHNGGVTSTVREATPPVREEEAASPFDSIAQKHEEMHPNARGGQKRVKKHVSFSEQLFVEEETEKLTRLEEEDEIHPQQLTQEGPVAGSMPDEESPECPHTEGTGEDPVTIAAQSIPSESDSFSGDPTSEASPGRDSAQFWRVEENDGLMTQYQSKASDHEGLLSDPLSDLPSASDVKSPVMSDLSFSLPSIPEVASDDERVDEAGDGGKAAKLEAGVSPGNVSPSSLEKAEGLSGRAHGSVLLENLHDFRSEAPRVAPSEQTAASGIPKSHLGKSSSVNKQSPGPGTVEEEEPKGSERPGSPLHISQGSPMPSPSPSATFPAAHSLPSSPYSDSHHTSVAEPPKKATEGSVAKVENFGKKKPLLQAWVTPSEIHPVSAQPNAGAEAAKHRLHPVKPMSTTAMKIANPGLGTAAIISENLINEAIIKKYQPSDPAFAYAQLTHDELIQLVLKQKETISKKEFQVRELEDYIDNLLVRVMEETPNILRVPTQLGKKAGKM
ncbi:rab11 family-interacting protein 1 isoform X1 [Cricetulus griseus]|uniref:rab11 family-interacting protein 1 isoform X1 n=1 Tax=Cricetulus griseus TaxID=10029 RepID=UPI00022F3CC6|nr:rab11 family-interacting protein 1 isoform X1 [Cricetulus griseus]